MFQLTGEQPELLGRQAATIKLSDAQTSRKHAEVLLENNTWLIRDLDSTNGTWVNGQKITQITELEAGDRIVIGRHQFRVSQITDLPAPSPKPLAPPVPPVPPVLPTPSAEPLIGQEELADMGVDLSESLSADLLDDADLELPEIPQSSLDDELENILAPTGSPTAQSPPQDPDAPDSTPDTASDTSDGVIDLDALLADEPTDDNQTPATTTPAPQDQDNQLDQSPSPTDSSEQGVIDLDALLADEPTTPSPADTATPPDAPPAQDTSTPDAIAAPGEVDFDLDEMLNEGDDPTPTLSDPPPDTTSDAPPAQSDSSPVSTPAPVIPTPPPADLPDHSESDSIDDIDAMLDDLVSDQDSPDKPDVIAEATPTPDQEPDTQPHAEHDTAATDAAPDTDDPDTDDPDSLIDIDILASATPTDSWPKTPPATTDDQDPPPTVTDNESFTTPDAPEDTQHSTPDDSGPPPDDSDILDSADTGRGLDQDLQIDADATPADQPDTPDTADDSAIDSPTDESPQAKAIDDDEPIQDTAEDEPKSVEPEVVEPELEDSERELLLSPDEQTQAVAGYKRSKIKTLATLALVIAALSASGWFAFSYFTNRADATQTKQDTTQPNTRQATHATDLPIDPPQQDTTPVDPIAPDATTDTTPSIPNTDTPPITPLPEDPPTNDLTQDTPELEPEPEPKPLATNNVESPTPTPTHNALIADPFADVTTTVFDTTPDVFTNSTPNSTPAASPNTSPAEGDSSPGSDTSNTTDTTQEQQPTTAPPAENIVTPDPLNGTPPQAIDPPTDPLEPDPATPDPNTATDLDQSQLDILAGVIDAQHKPGTQVADQAEFAGARRVVYVVDASGSLVDSFPRVLNELNLVISRLPKDQAFTAIFFGADGVIELPPVGLKWANPQTKRQARQWIDPDSGNVTAWGRGDFLQALQLATDYDAEEIILLSDNLIGSRPSQENIDALLNDIDNLTADKVQHIHVIQFFTRDPKQILKSIAERFNGTYNHIPAMTDSSAEHPSEGPLVQP